MNITSAIAKIEAAVAQQLDLAGADPAVEAAGRSLADEIAVVKKDMPNFFVEAVTISDGKVHAEVREIFTDLRQEEVEHMQMVREQMKNLPKGDGFDPSDYADEPVAQ